MRMLVLSAMMAGAAMAEDIRDFGALQPCERDGDTSKGLANIRFVNCVYSPVADNTFDRSRK